MSEVTLRQIRSALEARDPNVVDLVVDLAHASLPTEDPDGNPYREGAPTFQLFLSETRTTEFRRKPAVEQEQYRLQQLAALESDDAEVPCPDRLRIHEVIEELWESDNVFARSTLIDLLRKIPLSYGPWRAIKHIFKESEAKNDTEIYSIIAAKIDLAVGTHNFRPYDGPSVSTLQYMRRRAWQYLRRIGETLPAIYPDVATDFLAAYGSELSRWNASQTWIAAHIFFHESGNYSRNRFRYMSGSLQKHRAFSDLWRRSPRPLFTLLERAKSDVVLEFATEALKADFRASLREVEPEWVARLLSVKSQPVDDFAVWILENVPKFEQSAFRDLGLHDAVLRLLESNSQNAIAYGLGYARTHARDMDLEALIRHTSGHQRAVQEFAKDIILERDPRKEIGLEVWGRLLESTDAAQWVQNALMKHFGASELTPEWFKLRLENSRSYDTGEFLQTYLLKLHSARELGHEYFLQLIESPDVSDDSFSLQQIREIGPKSLKLDSLKALLINPNTTFEIRSWVDEGVIDPKAFTPDFLKVVAFHPQWETDQWVADFKKSGERFNHLEFNVELSEEVLLWLSDIRMFTPDEIGFEWLMQLVQRSEERYHNFAVDTMIRAFLPADFAEPGEVKEEAPSADADIKVDLGGQKFLFTGKLSTMTRAEAKQKVTDAGGANASGVAKTLDYLVIGDEGSPLYGEGRKGSKQLKAEALREEGADLKVISETAFLQMLTGEVREFSDDAVTEGCERLWSMMTEAEREDDPLAAFARQYFRRHHPEICLRETDRPVDPGAEIPESFLTFEQVKPLFSDSRKTLRDFALEMASWEFARWNPPIEGIIDLCEVPHDKVRAFVAKALTVEDEPEHKRYRIPNEVLTPEAVYSFCESNDASTRALGMLLIDRNPRLRLPEELFRLTESPDRQVRAFVVRSFWSLYRDRDGTTGWKPTLPAQATTGKKAKKDAEAALENIGDGMPVRPENPPAPGDELQSLLRRILYEIPPGPPEKSSGARITDTLKPLPNRKAKLYLIETLRDLALEEEDFGKVIYPLLEEFMKSRGKSEFEACLTAVTRLKAKWNFNTGEAAA